MKNEIIIKVFVGLVLSGLTVFSVSGGDTNTPTFNIPDIESNLVVKVVGFRKTESIVNGINVPIFTTDTNVLGRLDTGVLCCVVSPKQFAKTFFVLAREPFEREELWELTPSYKAFELGSLYKMPYSIKDRGDGNGTNLYFTWCGGLRLNTCMNIHSNTFTTSKLETAGDYIQLMHMRYYVSTDEARAEVERLRPQVAKYEKQLKEINAAMKEELDRREKLGIETTTIYTADETDKYSMLWKERRITSSLYLHSKPEMLNAEKQLYDYTNRTDRLRP
jgi:hypothetical protein